MARESKSTYGSIETTRPPALETDRLLQDSLSVLHNTHEISTRTQNSPACVRQKKRRLLAALVLGLLTCYVVCCGLLLCLRGRVQATM